MDKNANTIFGPENVPLPGRNFQSLVYNKLQSHCKDKILYVDVQRDITLTTFQIQNGSVKLAKALIKDDIKPGDIMSVICENSMDFVVPFVASLYIGATFFPLNPSYTMYEFNTYLKICNPKVIFCTRNCLETVMKIKECNKFIKRVIVIDHEQDCEGTLDHYISDVNCEDVTLPIVCKGNDSALVMLSSGTTGPQKGVELTFENLLNYTLCFMGENYINISYDDVNSLVLPCYHIFGLYITMYSLLAGSTIVSLNKFRPEIFLKSIESYKVTKLFIVPPIAIYLVKSPSVLNYDLSSVKFILSGAAPLRQEIYNQLRKRMNAPVYQVYGTTEIGVTTANKIPLKKQDSSGSLIPFVQLKVVHVATKELLGPNEPGEICIKGENVMKGYYNNPSATKSAFDEDGFFLTGDLGYRDEDGHIYVIDRIKEIIKYKGFQVAPKELEEVLLLIKGVADAAVIGVQQENVGEVPMAFVVKENGTELSEEDIMKFVSGMLAEYKWLRGGVKFVNKIPRNPSGKILKNDLRETYLDLKE